MKNTMDYTAEVTLLKKDLIKSIKREFAKAQKNNENISNGELVNIYKATLRKLFELIPSNVNGVTYLEDILLNN